MHTCGSMYARRGGLLLVTWALVLVVGVALLVSACAEPEDTVLLGGAVVAVAVAGADDDEEDPPSSGGSTSSTPSGIYSTSSGLSWYYFGNSGSGSHYGQSNPSIPAMCRTYFSYAGTSVTFDRTYCWDTTASTDVTRTISSLGPTAYTDGSTIGQQYTISDNNGCLVGAGTGPFCK